MALTDAQRLRSRVGEEIPSGGTDADTLFTDEDVDDFLETTDSLDEALLEAWIVKAAKLSTLVDTIEGSSRRAMSDAYKAAKAMIRVYEDKVASATGASRIHKIERT